MKVFVVAILYFGYVSARGSGPYLPRGWKPDGPAFFLPSEIIKPSSSPVQEAFIEDTETSGSDALREYGPPKLELFVNVNQGLPDVSTEQAFFIEVKNEEAAAPVKEAINIEIITEQAVVKELTTATDLALTEPVQAVEEQTTQVSDVEIKEISDIEASVQSDNQNIELSNVETTEQSNEQTTELSTVAIKELSDLQATIQSIVEIKELSEVPVTEISNVDVIELSDVKPTVEVLDVNQVTVISPVLTEEVKEVVVPAVIAGEQVVQTVVEDLVLPEVKVKEQFSTVEEEISEKVDLGVTNVADAIVTLENGVKANEDKTENTAELISAQVISGLLDQAPEGFLEYGPPGFTEYGPPKLDGVAQLAIESASANILENNEVRRRRFSPKLRKNRKH